MTIWLPNQTSCYCGIHGFNLKHGGLFTLHIHLFSSWTRKCNRRMAGAIWGCLERRGCLLSSSLLKGLLWNKLSAVPQVYSGSSKELEAHLCWEPLWQQSQINFWITQRPHWYPPKEPELWPQLALLSYSQHFRIFIILWMSKWTAYSTGPCFGAVPMH